MNLPQPIATLRTNTLALQFRPKHWAEVAGQETPVAILRNSLARGDIKPAYLMAGLTGSGKTTCSYIFARALLCEDRNQETQDPCGACGSCQAIDNKSHGDLLIVDGANDKGIDYVRNKLKPFLSTAPIRGRQKVVIIDEIHKYGNDAISAFLTMFEQMPSTYGKSVAILCTTETHKVLDTIRNRCLSLNFAPIDEDLIADSVSKAMGLDPAALRVLAAESGGSFRTVWAHLEAWEKLDCDFTEDVVMRLVNGVSTAERNKMWKLLTDSNIDGVARLWKTWTSKGAEPWVIARSLVKDLGRYAALYPAKQDWRQAMAILAGAHSSAPESAWPEALYMLAGLPLSLHLGEMPEPEKRQPTSLQDAPTFEVCSPLIAQRLLFFGA